MSDGFFVGYIPEDSSPGSQVFLEGSEAHHAAVVRRLAVGESVVIADGLGRGVVGVVDSVSKTRVCVEVESVVDAPESPLRITVAQAFPKTDRAELAVDLMTEVGVDEILGWAGARSQVRWTGERGEKAHSKWVNAARESSKQSRRLRFPMVGPWVSATEVARRIAESEYGIIMHEKATRSIVDCVLPSQGDVVIVIGPEGGLSDDEVRTFEDAGGQTYSMGETVLRTSTAGAVAVTQVRLLSQRGRFVSDTFSCQRGQVI
ncbi:MAG: 16S rRNA (uracil(1498)-N(3))-methyltransferase [Propionibacteriaceae bacterium]|nr:16S rRNA (uracil(1498)-N(3))-methyltransferase [Propionibacteriaceae bacterium]